MEMRGRRGRSDDRSLYLWHSYAQVRFSNAYEGFRWPIRVFNFLIDVTAINSLALYQKGTTRSGGSPNYDRNSRKKFIYELSMQLMSEQKERRSKSTNYIYKAFQAIAQGW